MASRSGGGGACVLFVGVLVLPIIVAIIQVLAALVRVLIYVAAVGGTIFIVGLVGYAVLWKPGTTLVKHVRSRPQRVKLTAPAAVRPIEAPRPVPAIETATSCTCTPDRRSPYCGQHNPEAYWPAETYERGRAVYRVATKRPPRLRGPRRSPRR